MFKLYYQLNVSSSMKEVEELLVLSQFSFRSYLTFYHDKGLSQHTFVKLCHDTDNQGLLRSRYL